MIAKITAPDLARDVTSAELQLAAHKEYKAEIDARKEAFDRFVLTGNGLIADGHFLADEIQDKVYRIDQYYLLCSQVNGRFKKKKKFIKFFYSNFYSNFLVFIFFYRFRH